MVIEKLREVTKAAEELICDLMRTKKDLLAEVDKLRNRVALLHDVNGKLFDKIVAQNKREALFLKDREKFLHEIHVRKKMKTLLIQERKEFIRKISGLKESEGYKELALNATNSRRKTKAMLLQVRKGLIKNIDAQRITETVLLHERGEIIDCFSKRIRTLKKRESQLLQERQKGEVFANPLCYSS